MIIETVLYLEDYKVMHKSRRKIAEEICCILNRVFIQIDEAKIYKIIGGTKGTNLTHKNNLL
jgi:hypothetical protein